jgi:hypothetical protein
MMRHRRGRQRLQRAKDLAGTIVMQRLAGFIADEIPGVAAK